MSRRYLDDADIETSRRLYEVYVSEATRMMEVWLPAPAHSYILKSSHVFSILDTHGAISITERAQAPSTMHRLMCDATVLWVE